MPYPWSTSVVRIFAPGDDGEPVGAGLLIASRTILTCAHVVNAALGRDIDDADPPVADAVVSLDFPALQEPGEDEPRRLQASVEALAWRAPVPDGVPFKPGADLALLHLADGTTLPTAAGPATLIPHEQFGAETVAFGFPASHPNGRSASGRLRATIAGGLIEVRAERDDDDTIVAGFSGTPLWVEIDGAWRAIGQVVRMTGSLRANVQPARTIARSLAGAITVDAPTIAAPAATKADVSRLGEFIHLVDRQPQIVVVGRALRGAQRAQLFLVRGILDDLPEQLQRRFKDDASLTGQAVETSVGAASFIDWPVNPPSPDAGVASMRDQLASALAIDKATVDDADIVAALDAGDRPRLYITLLYDDKIAAGQAETLRRWCEFWRGLERVRLRSAIAHVLVTIATSAATTALPAKQGLLGRLLGRRAAADPREELNAVLAQLETFAPTVARLPDLDECSQQHLEEWFDKFISRHRGFAGQASTMRAEVIRRLAPTPRFRLKALQTQLTEGKP